MSRSVIKSNNSIVLAGPSPAFKQDQETGMLFAGVQNVSFGFTQQRSKINQVGSYSLVVNDINRMPDVDLSIDYLYDPFLLNEEVLELIDVSGTGNRSLYMKNLDGKDRNFYIFNASNSFDDIIQFWDDYGNSSDEVSNIDMIKFGNCYITNYSLSFSVGQIPIVSTSYKCSNIEYCYVTGNDTQIPAINLTSGNNNNAGSLDLLNIDLTSTDDFFGDFDRRSPDVSIPSDVFVYLEDLQVGGVPLSGEPSSVTSFSFNIPIDRVDLFGLGSDYPYERKTKYPLRSSLSVEMLVSGYKTGELYDMINKESLYDFKIAIKASGDSSPTGFYTDYFFNDLRLESCQHQMLVNGLASYSMNFSHEINKV